MKPTYEELEIIVTNQAKLIEELIKKFDDLTIEVEELRKENQELRNENIELKKQLNIFNGPNTPSSQKLAYKIEKKDIKHQKKNLVKERRGKGHKGSTLVLKPTIIVDDHISECDHCHNVDLTNNLAERLLRDIVLHRKIRRFVASENGKMILVNDVTAFQTWKMKKMNTYEEMLELLENYDASA